MGAHPKYAPFWHYITLHLYLLKYCRRHGNLLFGRNIANYIEDSYTLVQSEKAIACWKSETNCCAVTSLLNAV